MAKHKKHIKHETVTKEPKQADKSYIWMALFIIAVIIGAALYFTKDTTPEMKDPIDMSGTETEFSGNQVQLDFYVMSQCPYGLQVENAIAPVLSKLGDSLDFNLHFIANDNGDGTFRSLHGQPEVDGNIAQLCAMKYYPDDYMDLIICQNQNPQAIPGNWEQCASGMDVAKIKACFEGQEGKDLLSASIIETSKVGATASPTIYLDGQKYQGGRSENDFMRTLCDAFDSETPQACADLPEPVKVTAFILNDKRCDECDTSQLVSQLKGIFPGLVVEEMDYSDAEGKKFFDDHSITHLPAILFNQDVTEAEAYTNVQRYLAPAGDKLSLRVGAKFDPTAEICDNEIDDTGNGLIDCADETCTDTMLCREEKDEFLQVFVMSDCPYGRLAIKALKEVSDNFPDMEYEVHYIATETADGFSSLHGQYEVDENIIQLCVLDNNPDEWMDYIYCRSDKGVKDKDWKECAGETGVDTAAVESCFGDQGADLLRADIKIAQGLGFSASPTWLANNKYKFSGIDAETVKGNYCQYNAGDGCDETLSGNADAPAGGTC